MKKQRVRAAMHGLHLSRSIGILALCIAVLATAAQAQRAIPDDNLAFPVLVQIQGSAASGFYLDTAASTYLVTAKHVLFDPLTSKLRGPQMVLLSYPKDPNEAGRNIVHVDLVTLSQNHEITQHSHEDIVVIRIAKILTAQPTETQPKEMRMEPLPGVTSQEMAPGGLLVTVVANVKKYDEVLVSNEVFVFGFPTSLGLQGIPQIDPVRPLLRRGIIAGQNPATKSLVIDCPTYPGNSGGPVLEADPHHFGGREFKVIGVVREFVPFAEKWTNSPIGYQNLTITNSGYTIVTPMDFVLELVK